MNLVKSFNLCASAFLSIKLGIFLFPIHQQALIPTLQSDWIQFNSDIKYTLCAWNCVKFWGYKGRENSPCLPGIYILLTKLWLWGKLFANSVISYGRLASLLMCKGSPKCHYQIPTSILRVWGECKSLVSITVGIDKIYIYPKINYLHLPSIWCLINNNWGNNPSYMIY